MARPPMAIEAVIFDCDGTLVDSEPLARRAWERTLAPHGYAVMCTDGDDDAQFLAGITAAGATFPLARHRLSGEEFAGACFSRGGRTLFANVQEPGTTLAIWGPW